MDRPEIDRWNVWIQRVDGEPVVSMRKQEFGPYVSYDEHVAAILKAREEAFEEAASKCGIMATNAESDEAEIALYAAAQAIRQHSQKGER